MKHLLISFIFSVLSFVQVAGQNYIYYGDGQYESTSSWEFKAVNPIRGEHPELSIAKRNGGGYVLLYVSVITPEQILKGDMYIFLANGQRIRCVDRGIRDHVDGRAISLYELTNSEVDQLKRSHIAKIRYNLHIRGGFPSNESFTAENHKYVFSVNPAIIGLSNDKKTEEKPKGKPYHETDLEVRNLFGY